MANDASAAIRYFRDSVKSALSGRTFRLSLQLSTLQKTLSSPSMASIPEDRGRRFYDAAESFLARLQDNFILEASLRYAEIEKHFPEHNEGSPFVTEIPTHEAVAAFFCKIMNIDKVLGHRFLSSLSIMNTSADPSKTDDELIEDILQTRNIRVFQEVAALTEASANFFLLQDLDRCIDECRKVNETPTYLQDVNVPVFMLYLSLIYPEREGGGSFRDDLHAELEQKRGIFTTAEYNAIVGLPAPVPAAVVQESPQKVETIAPSTPSLVVEPESESRFVPKRSRVSRPPRFKGDLGERAFRCLYDRMNDVFFECDSPENFTGLFRCPPDEQREEYTKINWINDNTTEVKCFIEALYRDDEYAIATAIPKKELSKIFLVNGKKKKLSGNSLYCWGDNKHIIRDHKQEVKIRVFLDLIEQSFKEARAH